MNRVALTGVKGMIGRHMNALLRSRSYEVLEIDRPRWDLRSWKNISELDHILGSVDVVYHFAAALPSKKESDNKVSSDETKVIFDVNVRSCLNLSEWALMRNIPIVFLSGATVYKNPYALRIPETAPEVIYGFGGLYGYSKLLAEKIFLHYVAQGLNALILRPSSVYGDGLGKDKLVKSYLSSAEQDNPIIISEPKNRINLVHAAEVAEAALMGYENKKWGIYNIASTLTTSVIEVAENAIKVANAGKILIDGNRDQLAQFTRFDLDCSKAKEAFGFESKIDINKGLTLMAHKKLLSC